MKSDSKRSDIIEELERTDRFFDGEEPGERPIDVLRARGVGLPDEKDLDDATLHERLWVMLRALAGIGFYVDSTDHLSDRELYRLLVEQALVEETILPAGMNGGCFWSPIGGFSEKDIEIYLRFYADDEERDSFRADYEGPFPPKEKRPYDRDRTLPQHDPYGAEGLQ